MTKQKMRKEIKFPVYGPAIFNMLGMGETEREQPSINAWIIGIATVKGSPSLGLYKWQKKDNPTNIHGWCYIDIKATTGIIRYVERKDLIDNKIITIIDEKQKHLRVTPSE